VVKRKSAIPLKIPAHPAWALDAKVQALDAAEKPESGFAGSWLGGFGDKQDGAIAQLGERLPCTQEVRSSILLGSTTLTGLRKQSAKPADRIKTVHHQLDNVYGPAGGTRRAKTLSTCWGKTRQPLFNNMENCTKKTWCRKSGARPK
jgi:hypothetical protein